MREITAAERIIEVRGLERSFDDVTAVRGLDLAVRGGELFAFLGPNGAGKSTTINILCTLLRPDAGTITIAGIDALANPEVVKERIGIVFQDGVLDKSLTVRENLTVRAGFYRSGAKRIAAAVDHAAIAADVTDFLDRAYGKLSGGQRRRADIARALLNTPSVLFLDEPTTGLDPQTRLHVWETIRQLQAENHMTVFVTTHYMEEASTSDYVVIIDAGAIGAEGTPAQLKERHTAELLRIVPSDEDRLAAAISRNSFDDSINVTKSDGRYVFELPSTVAAIDILNALQEHIESFEVLHGTMDDAFINVTGKAMRT